MKRILLLSLVLLTLGCTGERDKQCSEGETDFCACPGAELGVKTCNDEGVYDACQCENADVVDDTQTTDTGGQDTQTADTGGEDTQTADTGGQDTQTADTGGQDTADTSTGPTPDPNTAAALSNLVSGTVPTQLDRVAVTGFRHRPAEASGFFVQATPEGPAIFVQTPLDGSAPALGDIISLSADTVINTDPANADPPTVTTFSGLATHGSDYDISLLTQDVSSATDLVSAAESYESELITATFTLTSGPNNAGLKHRGFGADTDGISGNPRLLLRLPDALQTYYGLAPGCAVQLSNSPFWTWTPEGGSVVAEPHIWSLDTEVQVTDCPSANLISAHAQSATQIVLTFDRAIDPATLTTSDVTITIGNTTAVVIINNVLVAQNTAIVTTATQAANTEYNVTLSANVRDVFGEALDANTASYLGFAPPARVVINEVGPNIDNRCELVELRVTAAGAMNGWTLWSQEFLLMEFPRFPVLEADDLIVVHLSQGRVECSGGTVPANESEGKNSNGATSNAYANAFDWYSPGGAFVTDYSTALVLRDASGAIVDAVLLTVDSAGDQASCASYVTVAGTNNVAAEAAGAGQWVTESNTVPTGGFIDAAFCEHAVTALNTGIDKDTGASMQRNGGSDFNNKLDWAILAPTWGAPNNNSP